MSRKAKYSFEDRIKVCEDYLSGKRSPSQIAYDLGLNKLPGNIWKWIYLYKEHGPQGLLLKKHNSTYTKEFKLKLVEEYFLTGISVDFLSIKYKIQSSTIHKWILMYNSNIELKDYDPKSEVYMASAKRKTTIEERKEIVQYCIDNNRDYKGTAQKYDVSYSQVYSWVKKFESNGNEALVDKRGCHKADDEVDELEKLRRENMRLKRQLQEKDMVVELLKKLKEFERK